MNISMIKIFFLAALFLVSSCQKDEIAGYDGDNKNITVNISVDNTDLSVIRSNKLQVNVDLKGGEDDPYVYQWKAYQTSGYTSIISQEKNLDAEIELPIGSYEMEYKVTNTRTGLSSFKHFTLNVEGKYNEGWFVVNNKGGKGQFSFLRKDDQVFLNPVEEENNTTYSGKALAIYNAVAYEFGLTYLFTDQGVYRLGAEDFVQNGDMQDVFGEKIAVAKPFYGLSGYETEQLIINNGDLHVGVGPAFYADQVLSPFTQRVPGDYSFFPTVISPDGRSTLLYDNKHMKFMEIPYFSTSIQDAVYFPNAGFDLTNVGKTMIAAGVGARIDYYNRYYYMIMEDESSRYLYTMMGYKPDMVQRINNSPDIMRATCFVTSEMLPLLYYSVDNKIYRYDIASNSSQLLYSFSNASVISDMKMLRHGDASNKRLFVAANSAGNGEVYYFDIDERGMFISGSFTKKIGGFGEIVQLAYKNSPY